MYIVQSSTLQTAESAYILVKDSEVGLAILFMVPSIANRLAGHTSSANLDSLIDCRIEKF